MNGSHGVCRPGGTALNAGRSGRSGRRSTFANRGQCATLDLAHAETEARRQLADLRQRLNGTRDWRADRRELQHRMTLYAGHLRRSSDLQTAADAARKQLDAIWSEGYPMADAQHAIINFQLAFAHWIYLEAIAFQADRGVGSRGSGALLDAAGKLIPENPAYRRFVEEIRFENGSLRVGFVPCRPLPEPDGWFETVWGDYRKGAIYGTV